MQFLMHITGAAVIQVSGPSLITLSHDGFCERPCAFVTKRGKLTLHSADGEHDPHYLRKCHPEQLKFKKKNHNMRYISYNTINISQGW